MIVCSGTVLFWINAIAVSPTLYTWIYQQSNAYKKCRQLLTSQKQCHKAVLSKEGGSWRSCLVIWSEQCVNSWYAHVQLWPCRYVAHFLTCIWDDSDICGFSISAEIGLIFLIGPNRHTINRVETQHHEYSWKWTINALVLEWRPAANSANMVRIPAVYGIGMWRNTITPANTKVTC